MARSSERRESDLEPQTFGRCACKTLQLLSPPPLLNPMNRDAFTRIVSVIGDLGLNVYHRKLGPGYCLLMLGLKFEMRKNTQRAHLHRFQIAFQGFPILSLLLLTSGRQAVRLALPRSSSKTASPQTFLSQKAPPAAAVHVWCQRRQGLCQGIAQHR